MVHFFLASPFADAARAAQFAAVRAALEADAGTDSLLLGNLVLEDGAAPLDAVVVRPHGITLLVLVPRGGVLSIPALGYGGWQLAGAPLAGRDDFDNPFEQFRQQKLTVEAWLRPRFLPAQVNLQFISGVVVFEAPLTFTPEVEAALNDAPASFQLLAGATDLPRRLRQLATPEIDLTAADLAEWAAELNEFAAAAPATPPADPATTNSSDLFENGAAAGSFLGSKARALWGWLGANDIPDDDVPYGAAAALTARNEEKEHLEQLRQQMQADVQAQLQALETREAERERSIAQLRAELAQAPPVAADATALVSRLGAETREKAALEAEKEASKAELAARNQELDAKIQQLSQLIGQLSAVPVASAPAPPAPAAAPLPVAAAQVLTPTPEPASAHSTSTPEVPVVSILSEPFVSAAALVATPSATPAAAVTMPAAVPPEAGALPAATTPQSPVPKAEPALSLAAPVVVAVSAPVATAASARGGVPQPAPTDTPAARPSAPVATPSAAQVSSAPAGALAPALVAGHLRAFGERVRAAGARLLPRLGQLGEAVRARPRVLLGAAGAVVVVLLIWALAHRGSTVPVPYQENGRWGYANASGEPVIKAQFASAAPFVAGQGVVEKDGAFGLVDETGKEMVAPAYDAINPFRGGYARVRVGEAYTFLQENGEEFDHYFFNAFDFAEGRAAVLDHRGWFYLSGPEVPERPAIFREAYSFAAGLARVRLPDGYTFITAEYLADPASGTKPFGRYELAADFIDGKARVTQNGRSFVVDKDGEEVK